MIFNENSCTNIIIFNSLFVKIETKRTYINGIKEIVFISIVLSEYIAEDTEVGFSNCTARSGTFKEDSLS